MKRPNRVGVNQVRAARISYAGGLLATLATAIAFGVLPANRLRAQEGDALIPTKPLTEGQRVFDEKGCGWCHTVGAAKDEPGHVGPDLGRNRSWYDLMQLAGSFWNHTPKMLEAMQAKGIERPSLSPDEMGKLAAFLFYLNFVGKSGDADKGRAVFEERSCGRCHQFAGQGGREAPRLDELQAYISPLLLAQVLWNHGPAMAAKMTELKIERPQFSGDDVANLIAYLRGSARATPGIEVASAQVGNPREGQVVFRDKGCAACHAVNGRGGRSGPDLGSSQPPQDITKMIAAFWNHGPAMEARMKAQGLQHQPLSEREAADLLAYIYFVEFLGEAGDASRGAKLFHDKSCATCHPIATGDQKVGPDLAVAQAALSPLHWASAMWTHAPAMAKELREARIAWPRFEGDEMRDLAAFVRSKRSVK